jgi:hypothetical protein
MDLSKLTFLNRHHILRKASDPQGFSDLVHRLSVVLEDAFPQGNVFVDDRKYVEKVIKAVAVSFLVVDPRRRTAR